MSRIFGEDPGPIVSAASLKESEDEDHVPALPDGWTGRVLNRTLPQLSPDLSLEEARRYARNNSRQDGNGGMRDLQGSLVPVID